MDNDTNHEGLYFAEDVSAEHMAGELLSHFSALKALSWEPATNEREIAWRRAECAEILEALKGHLLT